MLMRLGVAADVVDENRLADSRDRRAAHEPIVRVKIAEVGRDQIRGADSDETRRRARRRLWARERRRVELGQVDEAEAVVARIGRAEVIQIDRLQFVFIDIVFETFEVLAPEVSKTMSIKTN